MIITWDCDKHSFRHVVLRRTATNQLNIELNPSVKFKSSVNVLSESSFWSQKQTCTIEMRPFMAIITITFTKCKNHFRMLISKILCTAFSHMVRQIFKAQPPRATGGTNLRNKRKQNTMQAKLWSLPRGMKCLTSSACPVLCQVKPLPPHLCLLSSQHTVGSQKDCDRNNAKEQMVLALRAC